MPECPKCGSYAVDAYLYEEKGEVYYGNRCLECGVTSQTLEEKTS